MHLCESLEEKQKQYMAKQRGAILIQGQATPTHMPNGSTSNYFAQDGGWFAPSHKKKGWHESRRSQNIWLEDIVMPFPSWG